MIYAMNPIHVMVKESLDWRTMSQFASQHEKYSSPVPPVSTEEKRSLREFVRRPRKASGARLRETPKRASRVPYAEIPFGAIHVDASGIVLEHRLVEAREFSGEMQSIVGRQVRSIAPWAGEPAFVSALKAAIDGSRVSFHLDFKSLASFVERVIHVNILAVGDKTAWIFISDKTLAMMSL